TREIGKSFWFAGFKVTLGQATLAADSQTGSPSVQIAATFENQGESGASFGNVSLDLASAGNHYQATPGLDDLPEGPGLATGKGRLTFGVDNRFSFDDAVLTVGTGAHQQAVVPLGTTGTLTARQPSTLAATGTVNADKLRVTLTGGQVRADRIRDHTEVDRGKLSLEVTLTTTVIRPSAGGYPLLRDNFTLKLPDGTTVAPNDDEHLPTHPLVAHETVKGIN